MIKALSSTCSITKFAKIAFTGWAAEYMFVESAINDEVVVIKHKFKQIHGVVDRHVCSFRDGRISLKSVLSHLECQSCWCRCEEGYDIERYHNFLGGDVTNGDFFHKIAAVCNSVLVVLQRA